MKRILLLLSLLLCGCDDGDPREHITQEGKALIFTDEAGNKYAALHNVRDTWTIRRIFTPTNIVETPGK